VRVLSDLSKVDGLSNLWEKKKHNKEKRKGKRDKTVKTTESVAISIGYPVLSTRKCENQERGSSDTSYQVKLNSLAKRKTYLRLP